MAHGGKVSPMSWVEVHLVDVIMTMASMQQPIMPKLGITLANSMVKGTDAEHEINEWQKKSFPFGNSSTENGNEPDQLLGMKWWMNFMK